MIQLEEITEKTCANHLRVLRQAVLSEEELHHRNCSGLNEGCPDYIPVKNTQLRYSYLRLYER